MQAANDTHVSEAVLNIMKKRVLYTDRKTGKQETPLEAYTRAAQFVAKGHAVYSSPEEAERFAERATEYMATGLFMPNTPTLVNAGFPKAQCAACFVLPVEDTIESIYGAHDQQGLIQASGGGTGFYLGNIRAAGAYAAADRFKTRGPINWLKMYNENATHVAQGMREGANIATLSVSHPDIVDFIKCKRAGYKLRFEDLMAFGLDEEEARRIKAIIGIEKFNISVAIPDAFMDAVIQDSSWDLIDPHTDTVVRTLDARELWELIVENAHEYGDPGLFFIDTVNRYNALPHIGRIMAPNPCGENPLLPYESCTMGHVNLAKMVQGYNGNSQVNWDLFEEVIRFGIQFLDDVVEVNEFPIEQLTAMNRNTRRIGLGVMGWADMLALVGIPYDSEDAISFGDTIASFFQDTADKESERLGQERGNFPYFEGSAFQHRGLKWRRNSNTTTIAPTGQTAMYAGGVEGGIEPITFPVKKREQAGMVQIDYQPTLFKVLQAHDLDTPELREELARVGSCRSSKLLPDKIKQSFPSAHDIDYTWHVRHQTVWQKYISSAVSKTINFPNSATREDVANAYMMAFKGGCKGITVYRDGTRIGQPISNAKTTTAGEALINIGKTKTRSEVTHGSNRKVPCGCGNLMIYCGSNGDERVQEITARLGKGGGCSSAQTEAIARMASVAMQHGAPADLVAKQLGGIRCHLTAYHKSQHTGERPRLVTSCGDAISVALSEHLAEMSGRDVQFQEASEHTGACPECGGQLVMSEGCRGGKCVSCGYSKCG